VTLWCADSGWRRTTNLHLIVVDDEFDVRRALELLLRAHGHRVTAFESAEDCLASAVDAHCAIIDIALPGISGLELNDRLNADGRATPVVFITAAADQSTLAAVKRARRPLLRKPLDEDDLLEAIARATGDIGTL
jgi:FixJ family two-component response regulator